MTAPLINLKETNLWENNSHTEVSNVLQTNIYLSPPTVIRQNILQYKYGFGETVQFIVLFQPCNTVNTDSHIPNNTLNSLEKNPHQKFICFWVRRFSGSLFGELFGVILRMCGPSLTNTGHITSIMVYQQNSNRSISWRTGLLLAAYCWLKLLSLEAIHNLIT